MFISVLNTTLTKTYKGVARSQGEAVLVRRSDRRRLVTESAWAARTLATQLVGTEGEQVWLHY